MTSAELATRWIAAQPHLQQLHALRMTWRSAEVMPLPPQLTELHVELKPVDFTAPDSNNWDLRPIDSFAASLGLASCAASLVSLDISLFFPDCSANLLRLMHSVSQLQQLTSLRLEQTYSLEDLSWPAEQWPLVRSLRRLRHLMLHNLKPTDLSLVLAEPVAFPELHTLNANYIHPHCSGGIVAHGARLCTLRCNYEFAEAPAFLLQLPQLSELDVWLESPALLDELLEVLPHCRALTSLHLPYVPRCYMTGSQLQRLLPQMPQLRALSLFRPKPTDWSWLRCAPQLTQLRLFNSHITLAKVEQLAHCPRLTRLSLSSDRCFWNVPKEEHAELMQALRVRLDPRSPTRDRALLPALREMSFDDSNRGDPYS